MRQKNRQAIYYTGFEAQAEDEETIRTIDTLLDGWLTKLHYFFEVSITLNNSPELIMVHASSVDRHETLGALQSAPNPFNSTQWASGESAAVFHQRADEMGYFIIWPQTLDDEAWMDFHEVIHHEMKAGQQLDIITESVALGAINSAGSISINQEIKNVISPYKFKASKEPSDAGAMRFAALFMQDDKRVTLPVSAPCAGYYTNIRMQCALHAGAAADDPITFMFGPDMDEDAFDLLPSSAGTMRTLPDFYKQIGVLFDFAEKAAEDSFAYMVTKHWGNRRLYIDEDDIPLIHTNVNISDPTDDLVWLLQADFVPKKGALYKKSQVITSFNPTEDWSDLPIDIPIDLENVVIEVTYRGAAIQVAAEVTIIMLRRDPNSEAIIASETLSGVLVGDIIKAMNSVNAIRHEKNVIGVTQLSIVAGGANMKEDTYSVPYLDAGTKLSLAFQTIDGTFAEIDHVDVRLSGIVANSHRSYGANFLTGSGIMNLDNISGL